MWVFKMAKTDVGQEQMAPAEEVALDFSESPRCLEGETSLASEWSSSILPAP